MGIFQQSSIILATRYEPLFGGQTVEALWIMLRGLGVVFAVMGIIWGGMWCSGKYFVAAAKREQAEAKAAADAKAAAEAEAKAAAEDEAATDGEADS